ncbi:MAG: preprotein translocase subunit SecE [Gammaproteobacteria bacterium]|jgi:preprotein translocase subunit SecE|nr:MAG: preprotein translocase subunit SecE [Gammaproteobacteria bacterium]
MSTSKAAQRDGLDGLKWVVVFVLIAAGAFGNSYYGDESLLYRVLALVAVAAAAGAVAVQTAKGRAFWELLKDARIEIRKVVWPNREETTQTTLIVLALVVIVALILWGLDTLLGWMISGLIG